MEDALTSVNRTKPQRKICEADVNVPTIIIEPFYKDGEQRVFVQWFGEFSPIASTKSKSWDALVKKFQQTQFRFPLLVSLNDGCWMGRPDLFKVVLLGQVRDWPNKKVIPQMGNPDDRIVWVVSSHYGTRSKYGEGVASFYIRLEVMPFDQTGGIITPKKYYDGRVLEREDRVFKMQGYPWSFKNLNA